MVERVIATPAALELIAQLKAEHGPELMFHQSGGCCDNSAANCYLPTDLTTGPHDVRLGEIGGVPFYMSASQYEYWKHTHLTVDVVPGRGSGFSVEAPEGVRFLIRSRLMTEVELRDVATDERVRVPDEDVADGDGLSVGVVVDVDGTHRAMGEPVRVPPEVGDDLAAGLARATDGAEVLGLVAEVMPPEWADSEAEAAIQEALAGHLLADDPT